MDGGIFFVVFILSIISLDNVILAKSSPACLGLPSVSSVCENSLEYPTFDGSCNNPLFPEWGMAGTEFLRKAPASTELLESGPNARTVSRRLFATYVSEDDLSIDTGERISGIDPEPEGLNMLAVMFGQFISHDADFTETPSDPSSSLEEQFPIKIENCTSETLGQYDELCAECPIPYPGACGEDGIQNRLVGRKSLGNTDHEGFFQPINHVSSYLDLNPVYGTTEEISRFLRSFEDGKLKTGPGDTLPVIGGGDVAEGSVPNDCVNMGFELNGTHAAGDPRVDENMFLSLFHLLFLREHNRLCDEIITEQRRKIEGEEEDGFDGDRTCERTDDQYVFQKARALNIAQWQHVVTYEWTVDVFGSQEVRKNLPYYRGYDSKLRGGTWNELATVGLRLHSMINGPILLLNETCQTIFGSVSNFTNFPPKIQEDVSCKAKKFREVGPDSVLRGALVQRAQTFDTKSIDSIRNIRTMGPGNVDVLALDIFRGRSHHIPDYYTIRKAFGLPDVYSNAPDCVKGTYQDSIECFDYVTSNATLAQELMNVYKRVDAMDPLVGIQVEDPAPLSSVGPTTSAMVLSQIAMARDTDRFWYERAAYDTSFEDRHRYCPCEEKEEPLPEEEGESEDNKKGKDEDEDEDDGGNENDDDDDDGDENGDDEKNDDDDDGDEKNDEGNDKKDEEENDTENVNENSCNPACRGDESKENCLETPFGYLISFGDLQKVYTVTIAELLRRNFGVNDVPDRAFLFDENRCG